MKKTKYFWRRELLAGLLALVLLLCAIPAEAYLSARYHFFGSAGIEIDIMFGYLSRKGNPSALDRYHEDYNQKHKDHPLPPMKEDAQGNLPPEYDWGNAGNPYVIANDKHL